MVYNNSRDKDSKCHKAVYWRAWSRLAFVFETVVYVSLIEMLLIKLRCSVRRPSWIVKTQRLFTKNRERLDQLCFCICLPCQTWRVNSLSVRLPVSRIWVALFVCSQNKCFG